LNRSASAFAITLSLAAATAVGAESDAGYRVLFSKPQPALSDADEREIFEQTGMAANGSGGLSIEGCGDVDASVELVDLNGDGRVEVFVLFGNTCWSGMAGSNLLLFVRDTAGHFQPNLGFPAAAYTPLSVGNGGFPDLQVSGPGFCDGVWRWDGASYQHRCNLATGPGGCDFDGHQCPDSSSLEPRDAQ